LKQLPFRFDGTEGGVEPSVDLMLARAVLLLRGMAYEHRLHILMVLRRGEQTPAALARAIPAEPTAIAHHLRYLRDTGLIRRRRNGRQTYYTLRSDAIDHLVAEVLRCAAE
jgi:DNA-binding transcriptional ArsR family regulator